MEAQESISVSLFAAIAGDTGAGGLFNASFAGRVRGPVYVTGDRRAKGPTDRPFIEINIQTKDVSPVPSVSGGGPGTNEAFDNIVTLIISDDRDQRAGIEPNDPIVYPQKTGRVHRTAARVRVLFEGLVMTALVDYDDATRKWYYEPMSRIGFPPADYTDNDVRLPISFRLHCSKGIA